MKKFLSTALTAAMLLSGVALASCDTDIVVPGPNDSTDTQRTAQSGTVLTSMVPAAATTAPELQIPDYTEVDPFEALFHPYKEIEYLEAYLNQHENLTAQYLDSWDPGMSVGIGSNCIDTDDWDELYGSEAPHKILDGKVETKWCQGDVKYGVAVVWSMTDSVSVTGYSITTANDNSTYTNRNPVKWRLYGANELPTTSMSDFVDGEHDYFDLQTVPDGWVLIDAVDAADPNDPNCSLLPDLDFYEVGFEAEHPGSYMYFMLIIDECEFIIQMSEFTLYGSAS